MPHEKTEGQELLLLLPFRDVGEDVTRCAIAQSAYILSHDKLDTVMQYVVLDKSDVKNSYRKYA